MYEVGPRLLCDDVKRGDVRHAPREKESQTEEQEMAKIKARTSGRMAGSGHGGGRWLTGGRVFYVFLRWQVFFWLRLSYLPVALSPVVDLGNVRDKRRILTHHRQLARQLDRWTRRRRTDSRDSTRLRHASYPKYTASTCRSSHMIFFGGFFWNIYRSAWLIVMGVDTNSVSFSGLAILHDSVYCRQRTGLSREGPVMKMYFLLLESLNKRV